jgi:hypothetical protein
MVSYVWQSQTLVPMFQFDRSDMALRRGVSKSSTSWPTRSTTGSSRHGSPRRICGWRRRPVDRSTPISRRSDKQRGPIDSSHELAATRAVTAKSSLQRSAFGL